MTVEEIRELLQEQGFDLWSATCPLSKSEIDTDVLKLKALMESSYET